MYDENMSIQMDKFGEFLGVRGQELVLMKEGDVLGRVPFHKARRAVISSGNNVSSSALFWLATYGVETAIVSKTGKLVATIVPASYEARANSMRPTSTVKA
jgi:CRISPR/Cas system-associated endonuclease Cas1